MSLSLGVVTVEEPELYSGSLIAELASSAKAQAKRVQGNALFVERRRPDNTMQQGCYNRSTMLQ